MINLIYFLVVIKYDEKGVRVLVVVVKGVDELVMYIRKIVIVNDVLLIFFFMFVCVIFYFIEVDDEIFNVLFMVVV